jgi:hypothetical protein
VGHGLNIDDSFESGTRRPAPFAYEAASTHLKRRRLDGWTKKHFVHPGTPLRSKDMRPFKDRYLAPLFALLLASCTSEQRQPTEGEQAGGLSQGGGDGAPTQSDASKRGAHGVGDPCGLEPSGECAHQTATDYGPCAEGLLCEEYTCIPPATGDEGSPCTDSLILADVPACGTGLYCDQTDGPGDYFGYCRPKLGLDEHCHKFDTDMPSNCADGLHCDSTSRCSPYPGSGDACDAFDLCASGLACILESGDQPGTCQSPRDPRPGEVCIKVADREGGTHDMCGPALPQGAQCNVHDSFHAVFPRCGDGLSCYCPDDHGSIDCGGGICTPSDPFPGAQ